MRICDTLLTICIQQMYPAVIKPISIVHVYRDKVSSRHIYNENAELTSVRTCILRAATLIRVKCVDVGYVIMLIDVL